MLGFFKKKDTVVIPLNTAVFTTKKVIKENISITRIYHDSDGTWQFFDAISTNSNENIMVVGLGEILKKDSTISEILNIPTGHLAYRKNKSDQWIISKFEQEE